MKNLAISIVALATSVTLAIGAFSAQASEKKPGTRLSQICVGQQHNAEHKCVAVEGKKCSCGGDLELSFTAYKVYVKCRTCGGDGKLYDKSRCKTCNGTGKDYVWKTGYVCKRCGKIYKD